MSVIFVIVVLCYLLPFIPCFILCYFSMLLSFDRFTNVCWRLSVITSESC